MNACELCTSQAGELLWQDACCRIIRVAEPGFPDFCRVIWQNHVAEMTDLQPDERRHLMRVVWATETALRRLCRPSKINLASLGNVVPHLHWHVIPRYEDDSHFPRPVWAEALRPAPARVAKPTEILRQAITQALAESA